MCLVSLPKNKKSIEYPNLPSAMRPVPHDSLPILKPPEEWTLDEPEEETEMQGTGSDIDPDFEPCSSGNPHLITQN